MGESLFGRGGGGGLAGGLSGGVKIAAAALLVQQLMKYAREHGSAGAAAPASGSSGPGGPFGSVLGGIFGGGQPAETPAPAPTGKGAPASGGFGGPFGDILGPIFGHGHPTEPAPASAPSGTAPPAGSVPTAGGAVGGLGGMLNDLRGKGLGKQVDSWVNPGPNQPVTHQDLERAFDPQALDEIARRAGVDRDTLLRQMAEVLPQAVDRMTPQGRVPQRESDLPSGGLGGILGGLFGR